MLRVYKVFLVYAFVCTNFSCMSRSSSYEQQHDLRQHIEKLSSPDTSTVFSAICALGEMKMQASPAVPYLIYMLKQEFPVTKWRDTSTNFARESAKALAKIGKPAVPYLLKALDNEQWEVRRNAAWTLGEIRDPSSIDPLVSKLTDESIFVRMTVMRSLGKIGGSRANESLIKCLNDEIELVRQVAAEVLGQFHNAATVKALVNELDDGSLVDHHAAESLKKIRSQIVIELLVPKLTDEKYFVRSYAADILGDRGDTSAVIPLIETLKSDIPDVRFNAIRALVKIKDRRAVGPLIELLVEEEHRKQIIEGLGKLGDTLAIHPLHEEFRDTSAYYRQAAAISLYEIIGSAFVDTLINDLKTTDIKMKQITIRTLGTIRDTAAVVPLIDALGDSIVYQDIIVALGQIGDGRAIKPLFNALKHSNIHVQSAARSGLREMDDPQIVESAIALLTDESADARGMAASLLGDKGDTTAVFPLMNVLDDTSAAVRLNAVGALERLNDSRAVDYLVPLLNDEDVEVRRFTAEALGKLGDTLYLDSLIATLNDEHRYVRRSVVSALSRIKNEKSTKALMIALEDEYYEVRMIALSTIIELRDKQMMQVLITVLQNDSAPYLRARAAEGLGLLDDYRTIEPLIEALEDESDGVRSSAFIALCDITGVVVGYAIEQWKMWWRENKHKYLDE
jgi:HEAT repeat protein